MEIVVVIPTYNEAENIAILITKLFSLDLDLGVLFVDDNSPDGTGKLVQALSEKNPQVMVLHQPSRAGLGRAYMAGFAHALGKTNASLIAQMDADLSHNPEDLPRLAQAARGGALAVGSRYVAGGGIENWSLRRRAISAFGNTYARNVLGVPITDLTSGFKCWPRVVLESLNLQGINSRGYAFQCETTALAHASGATVVEVPIVFVERRVGQSKMSLSIALEASWRMWQIRSRIKRCGRSC